MYPHNKIITVHNNTNIQRSHTYTHKKKEKKRKEKKRKEKGQESKKVNKEKKKERKKYWFEKIEKIWLKNDLKT